MTDAHCHVRRGERRHFLCDPADSAPADGDVVFHGRHPWCLGGFDAAELRRLLETDPSAGVGEIGLDRLREREIPQAMRDTFRIQLEIAAELSRPVVLHGAKCWGEVVKACRPFAGAVPAFLFHGFSRSGGLLPEIVALNGFVSVGPAVLNDHAVNYRELVKAVPADRLLVESDATAETAPDAPSCAAVASKVAELRGVAADELAEQLEANAERFVAGLLRRRKMV